MNSIVHGTIFVILDPNQFLLYMFIFLKQSIKTTFLLLLFITAGTYLHAGNAQFGKKQMGKQRNPENIDGLNYSPQDSFASGQSDTARTQSTQGEKFSIPDALAKIPINFRINSNISYLKFNHFVGNESKKVFFQAWLKEKEVQKLSVLTDSLRKSYSSASLEQREEIASKILKAEETSLALNEEIPKMYQNAREEENRYWHAASQDETANFQEKISQYKDSLTQTTVVQSQEEANSHSEISDTITLYKAQPKAVVNAALVPGGIVYKIQIGAYKGKIPESANKLIKKISVIRKVENYVDDKNFKVYCTGNLRLYTEAVTMLRQVKQEGIKTAVIAAYQNGKKTTVTEARKLNNEL